MKQKISITLNDTLMRFIDLIRGDVPRSKFIENYLKEKTNLFEAVWTFSDEMKNISKKELLTAHISQPFCKPLCKHEGFIDIQRDSLDFYDKELQRLFTIKKIDIKSAKVEYDSTFRRFKHSRGLNPPLRLIFGKKKLYVFVRGLGELVFKGNDSRVLQSLI